MAATETDRELAGLINAFAVEFSKFQVEYARQSGKIDGDLRELKEQVKGGFQRVDLDLRNVKESVDGDIRELKEQVKGGFQRVDLDIKNLRESVDQDIGNLKQSLGQDIGNLKQTVGQDVENLKQIVGQDIRNLKERVDKNFNFQKWLAGFFIPAAIALIGTLVTLAFYAGKLVTTVDALNSTVKDLSSRVSKLEPAPVGAPTVPSKNP